LDYSTRFTTKAKTIHIRIDRDAVA